MNGLVDGVIEALDRLGRNAVKPAIDDESLRAVNAVDAIVRKKSILSSIWGPPGTGKTTIYQIVFSNRFEYFGRGIIGLYTAPTNALVLETFSRQLAVALAKYGSRPSLKEITQAVKMFRVYGSKVLLGSRARLRRAVQQGFIDCGSLNTDQCIDEIYSALRQVIMMPATREVKWVISTEWQDAIGKLRLGLVCAKSPSSEPCGAFELGLFVDEASRSPVYRPFMAIARLLEAMLVGEGGSSYGRTDYFRKLLQTVDVMGLAVVGDTKQAISIDQVYKRYQRLLVLEAVHEALVKTGLCDKKWSGSACSMLKLTKRLPSPSHEPISVGFYEGELQAAFEAKQRLRRFDPAVSELESYKQSSVNNAIGKRVIDVVANAIDSKVPLVVVSTPTHPSGEAIELRRLKIAETLLEALFYAISRANITGVSIGVSSIYGEPVNIIKTTFTRRLGLLRGMISRSIGERLVEPEIKFSTVHALLGDEVDIHITLLGKEWCGGEEDEYTTLYYREPELLNVQLSRHRALLIVIGNIERLARFTSDDTQCAGEFMKSRIVELKKTAKLLKKLAREYNTYISAK